MAEEGPAPAKATRNQCADLVLIGIGNEFRHDDAVGLEIVRRVKAACAKNPDSFTPPSMKEVGGDAFSMMEAWKGADQVILADAIHSGKSSGRVHRLEVGDEPLPGVFASSSTHGFGLGQALELARNLGELPARVTIVGVEGAEYAMGRGMSPKVAAGCEAAAELILNMIRERSPH